MFRKLLLNWFLSTLKLPRDVHRHAFKKYPSRIMFQSGDKIIRYGELKDRSYRLAQAWQAQGVQKGDIVMTQVRPAKEMFEIRTAALELGVVVTSFHEAHPPEFIVYAASQITPKLFIVDPSYAVDSVAVLEVAKPEIPIWKTGVGSQYEMLLSKHQPKQTQIKLLPTDPMSLGFTSGTTGAPKGVIANHFGAITSLKMLVKNLEQVPDRSAVNINLTAIPLVGAGSGMVMPTMLAGGALVALEKYSPKHLVEMVKKVHATRLFVTPSQLIDLLDMPSSINKDLATVGHIVYGTAPMPAAKLEEAIKRFGPIFQQGYGQAEILPPVSMLRSSDHMRGEEIADRAILRSCGKVVDGVQVRISNPDETELPRGEVGEVHVNTPTRFERYLDPAQNEGAILAGDFFRTGDYGYLDDEDYLHILDRGADLITTDQGIIYPRTVEEEVHDHPAVKECCLVKVNKQVVLCVSFRKSFADASKALVESEILALLSSRLEDWQLPLKMVFVDEMPRSLLGKVLRREVRDKLKADKER